LRACPAIPHESEIAGQARNDGVLLCAQIAGKYPKRAAEGVGPYGKRRNGNVHRAGYTRPSARLRKTPFVNYLGVLLCAQIVGKYPKRAAEGVGPYGKRRNGNVRTEAIPRATKHH